MIKSSQLTPGKAFYKLLCLTIFMLSVTGTLRGQIKPDLILNSPVTTSVSYTATHSIIMQPGFSVNGANGTFSASIVPPTVVNCVPLAANPSQDQNYILTINPLIGITDASTLANRSTCEIMESIQYFDGLGRHVQTVFPKGNADATKDLIQPIGYDSYGRESRKYLPYIEGNYPTGTYRTDALVTGSGQNAFYGAPTQGIPVINSAYSETGFDGSPLNRVTAQGAPGDAWQLSGGHVITTSFDVNKLDVQIYWSTPDTVIGEEYKSILSNPGIYPPGELHLTTTADENWVSSNGKAGTTEEYRDKEDRLILRRTYNTNGEQLSTYYVYDYRGNLSFIIPPGANPEAGNITQAKLDNFCYQYHYDGRRRLIEKRIPGKGWEYMVYNTQDQLVMSQDQVQRNNNKWTFAKYDQLGRLIITGTCNSADTRSTHQGMVSQFSYGEVQDNSSSTGYSNTTYPTQNMIASYLIINYYDNYNWPGAASLTASTNYSTGLYNKITGSRVYNTDGTASVLNASYYDIDGRVVESVSQNHLGGTDRLVNNVSFTGNTLNSTHTQVVNNTPITIANTYVYDHMNRKRQSWEQINSGPNILLSQTDYNDLGQLYVKHLHSTNNGSGFLQDIAYAYNERGWLRTMNSTSNGISGLFNMELRYNAPDANAIPQFNGNITQMLYYGTKSGNKQFNYTYDPVNRLTNAQSTGDALNETIAYDSNSNITSLMRSGASAANLSYDYTDVNGNSGNQLRAVNNNSAAFRSYSYDDNGNTKSDGGNKSISYNLLNLPQTVTANNTPVATYTYDATGQKLNNTGTDGNWDYVNGIVYKNNSLAFIQTEEGRITKNQTDGSFNYEYNLTDHLGNVRVSFDQDPNGGARVIQEDQYYSFGLRNPGGYDFSNNNRYLYNGKELQTDLTNQYDYGARLYDPVIGRWNSIDPISEKHPSSTAYNYVFNNPVRLIDPLGLDTLPASHLVEGNQPNARQMNSSDVFTLKEVSITAQKTGASTSSSDATSPSSNSNSNSSSSHPSSSSSGNGISNTISNAWNSRIARAIVPDKLTVGVSSSVTAYAGFEEALSFDWITRGNDGSFIPYVGATLGGQGGAQIEGDALINFGEGMYNISDMRKLAPGVAANGLLGWSAYISGSVGFVAGGAVTGSVGFTGLPGSTPTWYSVSVAGGASIGAGVVAGVSYTYPVFKSQFKH